MELLRRKCSVSIFIELLERLGGFSHSPAEIVPSRSASRVAITGGLGGLLLSGFFSSPCFLAGGGMRSSAIVTPPSRSSSIRSMASAARRTSFRESTPSPSTSSAAIKDGGGGIWHLLLLIYRQSGLCAWTDGLPSNASKRQSAHFPSQRRGQLRLLGCYPTQLPCSLGTTSRPSPPLAAFGFSGWGRDVF
jgi:hypothetical protein